MNIDFNTAPISSGTLTIEPIKADLDHTTHWMTKVDPFCIFVIGSQKIKSKVSIRSGSKAIWDDKLMMRNNGNDSLIIEVWDHKSIRSNRMLGTGEIKLAKIINGGSLIEWVWITNKSNYAGKVLLEIDYKPDRGSTNFNTNDTSFQGPTLIYNSSYTQRTTGHHQSFQLNPKSQNELNNVSFDENNKKFTKPPKYRSGSVQKL